MGLAMKIRYDNRMAITTIALVSVIFLAAMSLMYMSAKQEIIDDDLKNETIDLQHTAECVAYLMEHAFSFEEAKTFAEAPWADGSDRGVFHLVKAADVDIVKKQLEKDNPESVIIMAKLRETDDSPVLLKVHSHEKCIANLHHTFNYVSTYSAFFLILLAVSIFMAIKHHTRAEIELKRLMASELEISHRIQNQMLPLSSTCTNYGENVEVGSMIRPARMIGGDYYNVFRLGKYLHFIIADVSGKGIPAALFMARVADIYSMSTHSGKTPAEVASEINSRLCHNNSTCMFATAIIGRLDLDSNILEICRAGHEQPLMAMQQGTTEFLQIEGGLPLGLMPDQDYSMSTSKLTPNSHLLLYTDGVTEAEDTKLVHYGAQLLVDTVDANSAEHPSQLIDRIVDSIRAFTGIQEQSDDITMLDIRLLPHDNQQIIRMNCDIQELEKVLAFADKLELNNKVMLALEEAVVNVFRYSGALFVDVLAEKRGDEIVLKITDDGKPFDPTFWHKDKIAPLLDSDGFLKKGGEGINLIMNLMNEVSYARINNVNILTLKYNDKQNN